MENENRRTKSSKREGKGSGRNVIKRVNSHATQITRERHQIANSLNHLLAHHIALHELLSSEIVS